MSEGATPLSPRGVIQPSEARLAGKDFQVMGNNL